MMTDFQRSGGIQWHAPGGQPKSLNDPKQLALARRLYADREIDAATTCRTLGISRATLDRVLKPTSTPPNQVDG